MICSSSISLWQMNASYSVPKTLWRSAPIQYQETTTSVHGAQRTWSRPSSWFRAISCGLQTSTIVQRMPSPCFYLASDNKTPSGGVNLAVSWHHVRPQYPFWSLPCGCFRNLWDFRNRDCEFWLHLVVYTLNRFLILHMQFSIDSSRLVFPNSRTVMS